ncbi:formate-dependent phosphoribosylglycinamide formyltransferase [Schaalia sp. lx-100]|uniref:formate-dependent phosphoribosylglycinamide formyltransferase n=1 Tax=Schaalia sp. lx-100 TaxID=2899081 RepID=UPI001E45B85C|nr:formate-dependent phosphoribosylglycinamide formyltransferase [Schaalia sp. lx-100]MCD4557167.1 formate-dependent phosphoribosylglycinamide formyltransferase [Schaalia sp. lx-100]
MNLLQQLPLSLPARILLLGSGELGKELTISFQRLGCYVLAVDSYPNAPAMQVAHESFVCDMTDEKALKELLAQVNVDLIVPEVEAIATHVLTEVEREGHMRVIPHAQAVITTMDRQRIRSLVAELPQVRTSRFRFASSLDEVREAIAYTGLPAFVKPTMSSSGHGQTCITCEQEVEVAWENASHGARAHTGRVIVEENVEFDSEITLLTIRWWDQESKEIRTSFCAPIGHRQHEGDYVESWQPAYVSPAALEECQFMACAVTDALADAGCGPALGLFGVEFFIKGDEAYFSELSPRPHDTGMVTMITQDLNEFDLHARAIMGLPVETSINRHGASAVIKSTESVEKPEYTGVAEALALGAQVRIFGKPVNRAGRRLGVVLTHADTTEQARRAACHAAALVTVTHRIK